MELSGVRSSWLVLDRKLFFARVAASAVISGRSQLRVPAGHQQCFGPGERLAHAADLVTLRA